MRAVVFVLFVFLSNLAMAFSYTLEIPEHDLQEKVDALMPLEKKKFLLTIRITDAKVSLLRESDEVGIFANIQTQVPGGLRGSGRAEIHGQLEYDAEKGSFYFKQPKIHRMEVDRVPNKLTAQFKQVTEQLFGQVLNRYPVYTLKEADTKQKLAKSALKEVKVKDGVLALTLSPF